MSVNKLLNALKKQREEGKKEICYLPREQSEGDLGRRRLSRSHMQLLHHTVAAVL